MKLPNKIIKEIKKVKEEGQVDKILKVDCDSIEFCGCSKHKSKQPLKLDKVVTPIERKNK